MQNLDNKENTENAVHVVEKEIVDAVASGEGVVGG